tara:strand:+ start:1850 stop:2269 length:420 start_codon:yes stop_codon:yes gene_type:complete
MVYLKRGSSSFSKGNITRVDLITEDPNLNLKVEVVKGTPQTVVKNKRVGRPRIVPYENIDNIELKEEIGITIKGMSAEQRRAYNRLASRKTQAKQDMMDEYGETATTFKKAIGKKIKDMTKEELKEYNKLSKREERLLD